MIFIFISVISRIWRSAWILTLRNNHLVVSYTGKFASFIKLAMFKSILLIKISLRYAVFNGLRLNIYKYNMNSSKVLIDFDWEYWVPRCIKLLTNILKLCTVNLVIKLQKILFIKWKFLSLFHLNFHWKHWVSQSIKLPMERFFVLRNSWIKLSTIDRIMKRKHSIYKIVMCDCPTKATEPNLPDQTNQTYD